jgi:RsiW-degrading membrane proteinase PrsW (M82 family)
MPLSKSHQQAALKAVLAIVMLAALAGVAGSQIAPHMPLQTVLIYCIIGVTILFAALVFAAIVTLTFNQFILRHGGTDPTWFWFKGEPPGLERQREQLKAQKD